MINWPILFLLLLLYLLLCTLGLVLSFFRIYFWLSCLIQLLIVHRMLDILEAPLFPLYPEDRIWESRTLFVLVFRVIHRILSPYLYLLLLFAVFGLNLDYMRVFRFWEGMLVVFQIQRSYHLFVLRFLVYICFDLEELGNFLSLLEITYSLALCQWLLN